MSPHITCACSGSSARISSPVRLFRLFNAFQSCWLPKYPVKRMRDAPLLTGQRQNKLFPPAAQHDINRHTALTGGFVSAAASYGPDYDSTDDATDFTQAQVYIIWPNAVAVMTGFPPYWRENPPLHANQHVRISSPFANGPSLYVARQSFANIHTRLPASQ